MPTPSGTTLHGVSPSYIGGGGGGVGVVGVNTGNGNHTNITGIFNNNNISVNNSTNPLNLVNTRSFTQQLYPQQQQLSIQLPSQVQPRLGNTPPLTPPHMANLHQFNTFTAPGSNNNHNNNNNNDNDCSTNVNPIQNFARRT
jgi:hypothetical protein